MDLKNTLFFQILKTLVLLEVFIAIVLFFDSQYFAQFRGDGQKIADVILAVTLAYLYWTASKRAREQIIYAVLIGIGGEYLFSIVFGMYTYRLENVPHYVPLGHAVVYLAVYYFVRQPKVISYRRQLELAFLTINAVFAVSFLIFKGDVLGFALSLLVLYFVLKNPRERLFYLSMYFTIAILELLGTGFGAWVWPDTWFGKVPFMPSGNPPSGISIFYFGLDLGCLYFYKLRHKIAWKRMKSVRRIRQAKAV